MPQPKWNVADAKSKLSEVLNRADTQAQIIRRRGHEYILMNARQYHNLTGQTRTFLDHLTAQSPHADELEPMPRHQTDLREAEL